MKKVYATITNMIRKVQKVNSRSKEHACVYSGKASLLKSDRSRWYLRFCLIITMFPLVAGQVALVAQPSGGPYGPVRLTYELPDAAGRIFFVAPDGKAENSGEELSVPTTIEAALEQATTGDAIVMRGGTYRTGNLIFNQGITILPFADEQPVLKGTCIASEWKKQDNGLWTTSWPALFPSRPDTWWRRYRHGHETPLHRFNNDMVFVDGKFLQSAGWEGELDENTYFIDYESGLVYLATDPTNRLVEITAFDFGLRRVTDECHGKQPDRKGPVIRGIHFTQYAYRGIEIEGTDPQGISHESKHGKEVIGTVLEHCTISYCSRVGAFLKGDSLKILNCKVSHTSTEGLYIWASSDVLLEKNIFTKNNIENITGYYASAVKIFNQSYRVTCRDNLVIDLPNSTGIWYDVGNVDGVFINNWIEGVGNIHKAFHGHSIWPSDNGFYFEISKGVICAGNVFVNCDHGICIYNSSGARIYQNTLVNSIVAFGRTARGDDVDHFGWHPTTGPAVDERHGHVFVNNLMTADEYFQKPLLFVWDTLCERLQTQHLETMDHNVYVRRAKENKHPLILWSPYENPECQLGFETLDDFRRHHPQFSSNSIFLENYSGPLFRSTATRNFQLLKGFPGMDAGAELPEEVSRLCGFPSVKTGYIGAYPPDQ